MDWDLATVLAEAGRGKNEEEEEDPPLAMARARVLLKVGAPARFEVQLLSEPRVRHTMQARKGLMIMDILQLG